MIEYFEDEIKEKMDNLESMGKVLPSDVDATLSDIEEIFKSNFPYQELPSMQGEQYLWTRSFIYKCLWAFSTDSLQDMGEQELKTFVEFVNYEEAFSFSMGNSTHKNSQIVNLGKQVVNNGVPIGIAVIGCTLQDKHGKSYEIYKNGNLGDECVRLGGNLRNLEAMKSLDRLFVDMLNDVPNNRDKLPTGELIDMTNSIYDNIKDIKDAKPNT